ncbi:hypothetical protein BGK37_06550 [Pasteurella multocida]|nr:hypothetical protein BGK37_06550 [Pasteurella multocida]
MKNILVAYDLNKSGQEYDVLIKAIESYIYYAEIQRSVCFKITNKTAKEVKEHLKQKIDRNDSLFVCEMIDCDWEGIYRTAANYINQNWSA